MILYKRGHFLPIITFLKTRRFSLCYLFTDNWSFHLVLQSTGVVAHKQGCQGANRQYLSSSTATDTDSCKAGVNLGQLSSQRYSFALPAKGWATMYLQKLKVFYQSSWCMASPNPSLPAVMRLRACYSFGRCDDWFYIAVFISKSPYLNTRSFFALKTGEGAEQRDHFLLPSSTLFSILFIICFLMLSPSHTSLE